MRIFSIILILLVLLLFTTLAFASSKDLRVESKWWIRINDLEEYNLMQIRDVMLSSDGSRLFILEHGFGGASRFLVFDTSKKSTELLKECSIPVDLVSSFAVNKDGTSAFIVSNYGHKAYVLEVDTGEMRNVFTTEPGKGFHFNTPVSVSASEDKDGVFTTQGYFPGEDGTGEGYCLASFDINNKNNTVIEPFFEIGDLISRVKAKEGVMSNISTSKDFKYMAYTITEDDLSTLYLMEIDDKGEVLTRRVDTGEVFSNVDFGKSKLVYRVDRGKKEGEDELVLYEITKRKLYTLGTGDFILPVLSPEGDRLLIEKVRYDKSTDTLKSNLFLAKAEDSWELHPFEVPSIGDYLSFYSIADDSRTFLIWSEYVIYVGDLP